MKMDAMYQALYCRKIRLFKQQFQLTKQEQKRIEDVCPLLFLPTITLSLLHHYPTSAPQNDLFFLQCLIWYKNTNPTLSKVVCCKFGGHLWYLSEELVALGFFNAAFSARHASMQW